MDTNMVGATVDWIVYVMGTNVFAPATFSWCCFTYYLAFLGDGHAPFHFIYFINKLYLKSLCSIMWVLKS